MNKCSKYPDSKSHAVETIAMLLPDFDEFREFFLGYKLAFADTRAIKTSFPPHSNNKTTSVAKRHTPYNNLITSLKTCLI
jgi:hypothetical protein